MKHLTVILFLLAAMGSNGAEPPPTPPLPEVATVLVRLLQRAADVAADQQPFTYIKKASTEELDGKGRVANRKVKVYEVTQVGGVTHARLTALAVNDQPAANVQTQAQREDEAKQKLTTAKSSGKRGRFDQVLTEELFKRFSWQVEKREVHASRPRLLLHFQPRGGDQPVDKLADRIINQLEGQLWVDEMDWEVVRAELKLRERVTLWGGLLGALDRFGLVIIRDRSPEGAWFVKRTELDVTGRKLFGTVQFRAREDSENFGPVPRGE